jgi:hypothetical protein
MSYISSAHHFYYPPCSSIRNSPPVFLRQMCPTLPAYYNTPALNVAEVLEADDVLVCADQYVVFACPSDA